MTLKNKLGFTLIEVLIYSVVLAIFLGLSFTATHSVFSTSAIITARDELSANTEFIERKLEWIMGHSKSISSPIPNSSSTTGVTVETYLVESNPAVFQLNGNNITLSLAGGTSTNMNNNRVEVSDFVATHISNNQTTSSLEIIIGLKHIGYESVTSSMKFLFSIK